MHEFCRHVYIVIHLNYRVSLIGLHQDEDVVDADRENEEGDDLEDDERRLHADEAEDADARPDGEQHDQDAAEAEGDFALQHERADFVDLSQREGDVEEHDEVRDGDGEDVAAGLLLQLVLHRPLRVEGDVHVLHVLRHRGEVLHELHEGLLPTHGLSQLELVLRVAAVDVVVVHQEGDDDGRRLRVVGLLEKLQKMVECAFKNGNDALQGDQTD